MRCLKGGPQVRILHGPAVSTIYPKVQISQQKNRFVQSYSPIPDPIIWILLTSHAWSELD